MPLPKHRAKEAYVHWTAGVCHVIAYPSQIPVCSSKHFRRATRKARNMGYDVSVATDDHPGVHPRDAVKRTWNAYILPATRAPRRVLRG